MTMRHQLVLITALLLLKSTWVAGALAAEPITIGLGIAQSGQLAANGCRATIATVWGVSQAKRMSLAGSRGLAMRWCARRSMKRPMFCYRV